MVEGANSLNFVQHIASLRLILLNIFHGNFSTSTSAFLFFYRALTPKWLVSGVKRTNIMVMVIMEILWSWLWLNVTKIHDQILTKIDIVTAYSLYCAIPIM